MNDVSPNNGEKIFLHPDVADQLSKEFPAAQATSPLSPFFGVPVHISKWLPKHPKKWEFPRNRFVEYEPSDEEWARPVGFGKEVDDTTQFIGYSIRLPMGFPWRIES